jgi:hypothetical protein
MSLWFVAVKHPFEGANATETCVSGKSRENISCRLIAAGTSTHWFKLRWYKCFCRRYYELRVQLKSWEKHHVIHIHKIISTAIWQYFHWYGLLYLSLNTSISHHLAFLPLSIDLACMVLPSNLNETVSYPSNYIALKSHTIMSFVFGL